MRGALAGLFREAHLLEGPITMAASYDDVDLVVELEYEGRLLTVPDLDGPSPDLTEEAPFSEGLTRFLSGIHADRAETSSKERRARVRLYFAT